MNIVIIGSGGREHAIAYQLKKSPKVDKLYCIPGNAGISEIAECVKLSVMDFDGIISFVKSKGNIDLVVVAPDDPLAGGLVDLLEAEGIKCFGPTKDGARLEASKAFSKEFMQKYGIPTPEYKIIDNYDEAVAYVKDAKHPLVIKADGLALGKGVVISESVEDSLVAVKEMMLDKVFGDAGKEVVFEEFLVGKEVSVLSFCDGKTIVPMVSSQDHKRALTGDLGLNTGGMGAFSPSKAYTEAISQETQKNVIDKTLKALQAEGIKFKGVIYFGLMLTDCGVKVLEYNARFGDPETQVVLPRLKTDLADIFMAVADERLADVNIEWSDDVAVCVILASGGYPKAYKKGLPITIGDISDGVVAYHAGTAFADGRLVTNGGRVLGVTAVAKNIEEARKLAYENLEKIDFENKHFRTDIGIKL